MIHPVDGKKLKVTLNDFLCKSLQPIACSSKKLCRAKFDKHNRDENYIKRQLCFGT